MINNDLISTWVSAQISGDPDKYGSDAGASRLTATYLNSIDLRESITAETMQTVQSIYRTRRKYLEVHPEFDRRDKALRSRRGHTSIEYNGQTHIIWGDDILTVSQAKELSDQLFDHLEDPANDGS